MPALAQGVMAWDMGADTAQGAPGLPGALRLDAATLDAWLGHHGLA